MDNTATQNGGGAWAAGLSLFVNCVFGGNVAQTNGGGLYNTGNTNVVNCTLSNNSATAGGGIFSSNGQAVPPQVIVSNSIVFDNTPSSGQINAVDAIVSNSDIEGGYAGDNINEDPDFVNAASGDFRLQLTSPCLNSGRNLWVPIDDVDVDNDSDLFEKTPLDVVRAPRFSRAYDSGASGPSVCLTTIVNMGAFETGDCDGDGVPDDEETDANGDGVADVCQDCDGDNTLDPVEIAECPNQVRTCDDCNKNRIPDECDIAGGCSMDKNANEVPDECECAPDAADVIFIIDTSSSMDPDLGAICTMAKQVLSDLQASPNCIDVSAMYLGINVTPACADFPGIVSNVEAQLGITVPPDAGACGQILDNSGESWGQATAMVAASGLWRSGVRRIIVPVSDEGPCQGDTCTTTLDSADRDSIENAIVQADGNNVFVFPITAGFGMTSEPECVRQLAELLALGAEGEAYHRDDEASWGDVGVKLTDDLQTLIGRCSELCPGDIDDDCSVNVLDLLALLGYFPAHSCADCCSGDCTVDVSRNCAIDVKDLLIILGNWSDVCPECCICTAGPVSAGMGGNTSSLDGAMNMIGFADLTHFHTWALRATDSEISLAAQMLMWAFVLQEVDGEVDGQ